MVQEKIKTWRLKHKLSRENLARLAGVTTQTVFRLETTGKINLQNYLKITETLEKYGKRKPSTNTAAIVNTDNNTDSSAVPEHQG